MNMVLLTLLIALVATTQSFGGTISDNAFLLLEERSVTLAWGDFDERTDVCTPDDNFCGWANPSKAIIYGSLTKTALPVPEGSDSVTVTVHVSDLGWGEGLAVDINEWTENSGAIISVDDQDQEERIPALSSGDPHYHHNSYYRHEFGATFATSFDVRGKSSIMLSIRMVDGPGWTSSRPSSPSAQWILRSSTGPAMGPSGTTRVQMPESIPPARRCKAT